VAEKVRCSEAGQKWFGQVEPELKARGTLVTFSLPRFAYNAELDTCLCSFGLVNVEKGSFHRQCAVWDVLANRQLAEFANDNGKLVSDLSEDAFNSEATRLMGVSDACSATKNWAH